MGLGYARVLGTRYTRSGPGVCVCPASRLPGPLVFPGLRFSLSGWDGSAGWIRLARDGGGGSTAGGLFCFQSVGPFSLQVEVQLDVVAQDSPVQVPRPPPHPASLPDPHLVEECRKRRLPTSMVRT